MYSKLIIIFTVCVLGLSACVNQKTNQGNGKTTTMENNQNTVEAIIIGFDARRCQCCGGFMVTFSNDPTPYKADHYQWRPKQGQENFGVSHSSKFPMRVKIKYKAVASDCVASKGEIEITSLEAK